MSYEVTYVNGEETSRKAIEEKIIIEPINQVVKVGTKSPDLQRGVRHGAVKQLKKDLAKAGFNVPGKGTTLYGAQTEKQVKAFQKYFGLKQSGKVDKATEQQLKALVNSPLQNGKRHKDTVQLKKDLASIGFKVPGNNTTLFGKQTETQLKAFQKKYNLVQNGIADEVTLSRLSEDVSKKGK